jgi:alpha-galactosidase
MGWNTWNKFHCDISAELVKNTTDQMVSLGLNDLGYNYMILDDCWQASSRDSNGMLQPDSTKFPDGMKSLGDYIHGKGIMFGIYSSAGSMTCQKFPGSLGHETDDAKSFSDWGVDYLKYDNCYNQGVSARDRYTAMANAITASGRQMFYSICNWGNEQIADWGNTIANSWRTTQDIEIYASTTNQWQNVKSNFLINMMSASSASPGHWNDPDMLQVGNGLLTAEEEKTHFALWAFAKAPLIIGCDLQTVSAESLAILSNKNLISINQDILGKQATCVQGCDISAPSTMQVYQSLVVTDASDGLHMAVMAVNWDDATPATLTYDMVTNGVATGLGDNCVIMDLYTGEEMNTNGSPQVWADIPAHGHVAKKIKCLPF